ncbi:transglutaminase-like domain-containing protein [bacterium]|nr:transglutaminase-like domain-containing protein [bacterium]
MIARLFKFLVVAFWAVMTAALVMRQPAFSEQAAEDLPSMARLAAAEGPSWYGVYFVSGENKVKIGYSRSEIRQATRGSIFESEQHLRIEVQGQPARVRVLSTVLTDEGGNLLSIDFSMLSDTVKFELFGRVSGEELLMEIRTAAGIEKRSMPMPKNTRVPDTALREAVRRGLDVGDTIDVPIFDPSSFSFSDGSLRVVEKTTLPETGDTTVYHLAASFMGLDVEAWIDGEGHTIQERAANLLTRVETKEQALTAGWGDAELPVDIVEAAAVHPAQKIKSPRGTTFVKLRLSGVDLSEYSIADQRQYLDGDIVTVEIERPGPTTFTIPITDPAMTQFLESTPTIQAGDPAIRAKMREIVGDETNAYAAAKAISTWVYETLEKKPLVSIPSARDVLDIKRGDCNEHATLYAALARAAGIPTRIEVGLVYNDQGFYYHAWNAVWAGRWFSIDPTFGQFPADAAHLKVISGDLSAQIAIIKMIGNLKIDVLEAR